MTKQPTATAFTRTQESWAKFALGKVREQIEDREEALRERGWRVEEFDSDDTLVSLYEDELFYERYAEEMASQRGYIRMRYLGG